MSAHLNRPKMEVDHALKNTNKNLESEGPDVMQAVQSLLILVAIFEVFPIFGWLVLFLVAIHLISVGICGYDMDKVHTSMCNVYCTYFTIGSL